MLCLYTLEVCNLNKNTMQSLDFTLNRFFMKLLRTSILILKLLHIVKSFLDVIYLV